MKFLINRKPITGPWGGGNLFVKSFCKILTELGHEVVHTLEDNINIFFIMNPRYDSLGISINEAIAYKSKFPKTMIVQRINDCDARKGTKDVDELLIDCSRHLDATIFVSSWMKDYFLKKGWHCKNNHIVINGVAVGSNNIKKINNGKVNIVTHHWSNNYLKGFDVYDKLDEFVGNNKDFTFTYIGRDRGSFKNTNIIAPLHGKNLYNELKKYDIYISGSRFDPGPNHILESLACNLPTYVHEEGGGCVEFAGNTHTFNSFVDLRKVLEGKIFKQNITKAYNWKESIQKLNSAMRQYEKQI